MWKYVARRALASIPVLLLASVLIFLLVREFGADPARQRCQASRDPQCIVRVRAQLELDRPVPVQYLDEMKSFVTGDWGNSLRSDRSVSELIRDAMAETVPLAFWAVVVSLVRSNDLGEVGFLSDVRRMNVAITRARKKLVVVGDSATVARHPFYESFVRHAQETGAWRSAWERE